MFDLTGSTHYHFRDSNLTIYLGESLSFEGISHLFELGLRQRHKKISDAWRKDISDLRIAQDEALSGERQAARRALEADFPRFKSHVKDQILARVIGLYP